MKDVVCYTCKEVFKHIDARTKYCTKCSKKPKQMVQCDVCGTLHSKKPSKLKNNTNNFCTKECKNSIKGRELLEITIKKSLIEKYGESSYFKTEEFKEISKESQIKKYGDIYVRTKEYINKKESTCLKKFGVTDAMKCDEVKNKAFKSHRYNRYNEFSLQIKEKHITLLSTIDEFANNIITYKCDICHNTWSSDCRNIQHVFCESNECRTTSISEYEILKFVESNCKHSVSTQVRKTINGKQLILDLVIEELKTVIEYHGLYWHTTKFRDKNYHLNRYKILTDAGYSYIQIYSHEWENRKNAVKGILLNKLGNSKVVYARKLTIKEVQNDEYSKFMNMHHVQGTINAKVKLGLYDSDNKCIQIASFTEYEDRWECARLCTIYGINVVGGFNRLLKEFITKYSKQKRILSYVNLRYFSGSAYIKSNFLHDGNTDSGYFYTNGNIVLSRQKCQKHKLHKMLDKYDNILTEEQNMNNNNYYRVYDSGNARMIYNQNILDSQI